MLIEPKSFTPAGNLSFPGYAKAIKWISEIWTAFDSTILARSFDQCGITSGNPDDYHLQLRQFVSTQKFMDTIVPADPVEIDTLSVLREMAIPWPTQMPILKMMMMMSLKRSLRNNI